MMHGFLYEIGPGAAPRQYVIEQDHVLIGRGSDCDVILRGSTVSRRQALITTEGGCRIADLGAANLTMVNGAPIGRDPIALADGDVIKVGASSLRYVAATTQEGAAARIQDPTRTADMATALVAGTLGQALLCAPTELLTAEAGVEGTVSVVLASREEPGLLVREGDRTHLRPLRDAAFWTIGRGDRCAIRVTDPKASREHARLERTDAGFVLRDPGSVNGTLVNGARIVERVLADDDVIRIGDAMLIFRAGEAGAGGGAPGATTIERRTPVVLVPGLCGTELFRGQTRIWPNFLRLVSCAEEALPEYWGDLTPGRVARETVVVPGLVKMEAFGRLVDFLCEELGYTEGLDLLEFGYDWRQDNRASARLLKERVASWRRGLSDPHAKVVFIAHSMGGLLCRYYLEHLGGADACARLILLGTPNRGSARAFNMAVSGRGALPLSLAAARVRKMVLHFPSVYQLLPGYPAVRLEGGEPFMPLSDDGWLPADFRGSLAAGRVFREALAATEPRTVPTTCVFGYGQKTLVGIRVRRERDGMFEAIEEIFDEAGDDAVTEESAVLERAEIHPVQQRHGALYADRDVQKRLRYELVERRR